MKKIFLSVIIVAGLFVKPVVAQENVYSFTYTMGFSTGDFGDFISKPSFRGATFDYRRLLQDNIGVGIEIGWNAWYEEMDYATYTPSETGSISGKQFRYCSTVPMLVSANYYILPGEKFNPFGGLGIGTQFTANEVDMGVWAFTDDVWHFLIKPEIGAIIEVAPGLGVIMSGKYYMAFETKDVSSRSYIAANVGLAWGF